MGRLPDDESAPARDALRRHETEAERIDRNLEELLQELIGTDPGLAPLKRLLIERTEGNPFFLEESVRALVETKVLAGDPGAYRLTFDVADYQRDMGMNANFFPEVRITFNVKDTEEHYHIPLLLSPFGYTTYRGA